MSKDWGYCRKSTVEQHIDRQVVALKQACPSLHDEDIIIDAKTGKNFTERTEYKILKRLLRKGDTLWIKDTERLGRNKGAVKLELQWMQEHGIRVKILSIPTTLIELENQGWVLNLINTLILEIFTSLDENDYYARRNKQAEGIAIAKQKGVYKGRKPMEIDKNKFAEVYRRWKIQNQLTAVEAQKLLGLTNSTFYRKVKRYEQLQESQNSNNYIGA